MCIQVTVTVYLNYLIFKEELKGKYSCVKHNFLLLQFCFQLIVYLSGIKEEHLCNLLDLEDYNHSMHLFTIAH